MKFLDLGKGMLQRVSFCTGPSLLSNGLEKKLTISVDDIFSFFFFFEYILKAKIKTIWRLMNNLLQYWEMKGYGGQ